MISHIRLAAFAALLTLTSNAAAQAQTPTLEDGQQAFQRHDYGMAAQIWFPLAQQGNAEAQDDIGLLFLNGLGTAQNYKEAVKWFRMAADQGFAQAQFLLGTMYEQGKGVDADKVAALKWYRLAADQGYSWAQFALGNMYLSGSGTAQDNTQAFNWFQK